jgi:hypothetical protein
MIEKFYKKKTEQGIEYTHLHSSTRFEQQKKDFRRGHKRMMEG